MFSIFSLIFIKLKFQKYLSMLPSIFKSIQFSGSYPFCIRFINSLTCATLNSGLAQTYQQLVFIINSFLSLSNELMSFSFLCSHFCHLFESITAFSRILLKSDFFANLLKLNTNTV